MWSRGVFVAIIGASLLEESCGRPVHHDPMNDSLCVARPVIFPSQVDV